MGDMIDMYREMKEAESTRRAERRASAPDKLRACGIAFAERNGGAHLIINTSSGCVDFWPGTQKWISRLKNKAGQGRGFKSLFSFLDISQGARINAVSTRSIPNYILQKIRQVRCLKRDDDIFDRRISDDSAMQRLRDVASWELGDSAWADRFVTWATDCGFEIVDPAQKNIERQLGTN